MEIIYEESIYGGVFIRFKTTYKTVAAYHEDKNILYIEKTYIDQYFNVVKTILNKLNISIDGKNINHEPTISGLFNMVLRGWSE